MWNALKRTLWPLSVTGRLVHRDRELASPYARGRRNAVADAGVPEGRSTPRLVGEVEHRMRSPPISASTIAPLMSARQGEAG